MEIMIVVLPEPEMVQCSKNWRNNWSYKIIVHVETVVQQWLKIRSNSYVAFKMWCKFCSVHDRDLIVIWMGKSSVPPQLWFYSLNMKEWISFTIVFSRIAPVLSKSDIVFIILCKHQKSLTVGARAAPLQCLRDCRFYILAFFFLMVNVGWK